MNYRFEVHTAGDRPGVWTGNGQVFKTESDAKRSAQDLMMRWTAVRDYRVVETEDPATEDGPYEKGWDHRVQL